MKLKARAIGHGAFKERYAVHARGFTKNGSDLTNNAYAGVGPDELGKLIFGLDLAEARYLSNALNQVRVVTRVDADHPDVPH